jgi:hypothetical protein
VDDVADVSGAWHRKARTAAALLALVLLDAASGYSGAASAGAQLGIDPKVLAAASPELLDRVRADPYNYFRLVNRDWTARVCEAFAAELPTLPTVQLHGDAHVEQYALMSGRWGLDDFDDSARGPAIVDIVRFLGSIDLALRQRGWTGDRNALFDRFMDGYRRGLSDPSYRPAAPAIVGRLRAEDPPRSPAAFLTWGESIMTPMSDASMKAVLAAVERFAPVVQRERPDLRDGYFRVSRAGWLDLGIGSAVTPKILMRVQGPTANPEDDALIEAKALRSLEGVACLELPASRPALRVIAASEQLGRLKHNILAVVPEPNLPEVVDRPEYLRDWWVRSWDRTYREIGLHDLRSSAELSGIVYDSGVQLGAGSVHRQTGENGRLLRTRSLTALTALDQRLRTVSTALVEELLKGWREFGGR